MPKHTIAQRWDVVDSGRAARDLCELASETTASVAGGSPQMSPEVGLAQRREREVLTVIRNRVDLGEVNWVKIAALQWRFSPSS